MAIVIDQSVPGAPTIPASSGGSRSTREITAISRVNAKAAVLEQKRLDRESAAKAKAAAVQARRDAAAATAAARSASKVAQITAASQAKVSIINARGQAAATAATGASSSGIDPTIRSILGGTLSSLNDSIGAPTTVVKQAPAAAPSPLSSALPIILLALGVFALWWFWLRKKK